MKNLLQINPRKAVPQFYRGEKTEGIEFLLPFTADPDHPQFTALSVQLVTRIENGEEKKYYMPQAIINLKNAYNNARQLHQIDQDWLKIGLKKRKEKR